MSGVLNMGSSKITSLATPTADSDASTKKYGDDSHKVDIVDAAHTAAQTSATYFNINTPNTNGYHTAINPSDLISPKKIIKLNLENFARHNLSVVQNTMAILGKLKNFTGYVNNVVLIIKSQTSAGLTSVQMKGSTGNLPNHFTIKLSEN